MKLALFDDRDDPDLAQRRAEEIVADGRYLGVIGHRSSGASLRRIAVTGRHPGQVLSVADQGFPAKRAQPKELPLCRVAFEKALWHKGFSS